LTCYEGNSDDVVGVKCENTIESLILIISLNKIGITYIPLDTEVPKKREEYIIKSLNLKLIIDDIKLKKLFQNKNDFCRLLKKEYIDHQPIERIIYYMFTSGTTGKPKGIPIKEKSVINLSNVMNKEIFEKHNKKLTVGLMAPIHFDASVQFIFSTLMYGHTLHVIPKSEKLDPNKLCTYLSLYNIEVIDCSPRHIQLLNESYLDINKINVSHFVIGGEQLYTKYLKKYIERIDKSRTIIFSNVYGPTECCVDSTIFHIDSDQIRLFEEEVIPIGKAIDNVNVFLINEKGMVDQKEGEICISGINLTSGYLDKSLNKNKFITNHKINSEVYYKTGDFGKYTKERDIIFIERKDAQVNIYGNRIELDEIKSVFDKIKGVIDSYITTIKSDSSEFIILYYSSNEVLNEKNITKFLKDFLPEYMIPNFFINIESFPLKSNGKIDTSKLPLPFEPKKSISSSEKTLFNEIIEIFNKYLPVPINVNKDSVFKEMGGDSLIATRVVSEIKKQVDIEFSTVDLLTSKSLFKTIQNEITKFEKKRDYNLDKIVNNIVDNSIVSNSILKQNIQKNKATEIKMGLSNSRIAKSSIKYGLNNIINFEYIFESSSDINLLINTMINEQEIFRYIPRYSEYNYYFSNYDSNVDIKNIDFIIDVSPFPLLKKQKIIDN
ncbi:non-ribosomal peptide synthetase, partial [Macrococcus capreoli]|uniref:non-ribosomal peptide synthetase n=1 Tax=Macrococcus capreoli TaxID=2982690 RepID=UPI003F41F5AB